MIGGWLIGDEDPSKKQRHTARKIWQRLVAEHEATLADVTVSRYVARRRMDLGLDQREVTIPKAGQAGAEAAVDFGEFYAIDVHRRDYIVYRHVGRHRHRHIAVYPVSTKAGATPPIHAASCSHNSAFPAPARVE